MFTPFRKDLVSGVGYHGHLAGQPVFLNMCPRLALAEVIAELHHWCIAVWVGYIDIHWVAFELEVLIKGRYVRSDILPGIHKRPPEEHVVIKGQVHLGLPWLPRAEAGQDIAAGEALPEAFLHV